MMHNSLFVLSLSLFLISFHTEAASLPNIDPYIDNNLITKAAALGDNTQKSVPREYKNHKKGVGVLVDHRGRFCTAFCVTSEVIATAGHCLASKDDRGRSRPISKFRFKIPGNKNILSAIEGNNNAEMILNTFVGTTRLGVQKLKKFDQLHYDWALVRLNRPVCKGRELKIQSATFNELSKKENSLFSIFYQLINKKMRIRYSLCTVDHKVGRLIWTYVTMDKPFPDDILLHNCDADPGASGAPIFLVTEIGPIVVGIHTGNLGRGNKKEAKRATNIRSVIPFLDILKRPQKYPSKDLTKSVQQLLKNTGDYKGGIDGVYGRGTRQAILDFTIRHSLPIMFDRPLEELLPIMEKNQTLAPFPAMLNAFEVYTYNPIRARRHKAFAVNFDEKTWRNDSNPGTDYSANEIECYSTEGKISKCELYAINDRIIYRNNSIDKSKLFPKINYNIDSPIIRNRDNIDLFKMYIHKNKKGVDYKSTVVNTETGLLNSCEKQSSPYKAQKCALELCNAQNANCQIFSIGNKIIFGLDKSEIEMYKSYYKAVLN